MIYVDVVGVVANVPEVCNQNYDVPKWTTRRAMIQDSVRVVEKR